MTPEQLEAQARGYEGAIQNERASDFDWKFVPDFPLEKVQFQPGDGGTTPEGWADFLRDEIKMWDEEEGQPDRFNDLLEEPIREAIIVHLGEDGMGYLWDGCHRTGATATKGLPTIAAIVGTRKSDFWT